MAGRVRVKICGVTNVADALAAVELGADAVGLNFYPQSPRYLTPQKAGVIIRQLPPFVEPVGVFAGTLAEIVAVARQVPGLRTVQRHSTAHEVGDSKGYRVIDAFQVPDRHSLSDLHDYLRRAEEVGRKPVAVLVDGCVPGQFGGTGKTAPWELFDGLNLGLPLILAGGLTPENVAEAVRIVRPYAVDVASGVEASPGKKDIEKMRRFIENARSV